MPSDRSDVVGSLPCRRLGQLLQHRRGRDEERRAGDRGREVQQPVVGPSGTPTNIRSSICSMTHSRPVYPMKYVPNSPRPGRPKGMLSRRIASSSPSGVSIVASVLCDLRGCVVVVELDVVELRAADDRLLLLGRSGRPRRPCRAGTSGRRRSCRRRRRGRRRRSARVGDLLRRSGWPCRRRSRAGRARRSSGSRPSRRPRGRRRPARSSSWRSNSKVMSSRSARMWKSRSPGVDGAVCTGPRTARERPQIPRPAPRRRAGPTASPRSPRHTTAARRGPGTRRSSPGRRPPPSASRTPASRRAPRGPGTPPPARAAPRRSAPRSEPAPTTRASCGQHLRRRRARRSRPRARSARPGRAR